MKINYQHKKFKGVSNSPSGQIGAETLFEYHQEGNVLTATYSGGSILHGYMLGRVNEDNSLFFLYHHLDEHNTLKSGSCYSRPEVLPDGRLRMHEIWEWTHGGFGEGTSIVEEIKS